MQMIRGAPVGIHSQMKLTAGNSKAKNMRTKNVRISGIAMDVISWATKKGPPNGATRSAAARDGKKPDEGTMTSSPDANPTTIANAQTLAPAAATCGWEVLMNN
jgi:hypothetical protein